MRLTGIVQAVEIETAGSWTVGAVLAGATTLPVDDMSAFDETGGTATVGDESVTYTEAVDGDGAGDYLTLSPALITGVSDRTSVLVDPPVETKTAWVLVEGVGTYQCDVPSGDLWFDSRLDETATGGQSVDIEQDM
jgi:hypothetical protein